MSAITTKQLFPSSGLTKTLTEEFDKPFTFICYTALGGHSSIIGELRRYSRCCLSPTPREFFARWNMPTTKHVCTGCYFVTMGATCWRRAQHRFPSPKPSMPILPAALTSSRASRLRLAARHSNVESGGRSRTIPAGTTVSYGQLADHLGENRASRAVGAANGANPIAIVVPSSGYSERTAGSPAMPVAFFASSGSSNMKRAFPRSQRVKSVSKTADRSECPRVWPHSIKNRVPQCRALFLCS